MIKTMKRTVADKYGSRRGLYNTEIHRLKYYLGRYNHYKQVNWQHVDRLVFVCKGNICRSAYSEAVAHNLGLSSASCGVDTRSGVPANPDAIRVASARGVDLSAHKTTQIQMMDYRDGDLFLAMEPWHIDEVNNICQQNIQSTLVGLWGDPVTPFIVDPYGTSDLYFHHCFSYLEKVIQEIANKI